MASCPVECNISVSLEKLVALHSEDYIRVLNSCLAQLERMKQFSGPFLPETLEVLFKESLLFENTLRKMQIVVGSSIVLTENIRTQILHLHQLKYFSLCTKLEKKAEKRVKPTKKLTYDQNVPEEARGEDLLRRALRSIE